MATEKRLIDANVLKNKIAEENPYIHLGPFGYCACSPKTDAELVFKREEVLQAIDSAPTVDSVEVVHGRWIELPSMEPDYKCSECGRTYAWWEPREAHFCPNCGAKMDGERRTDA